MTTFGRNLLDVVTDRALGAIRGSRHGELRRMVLGAVPGATPGRVGWMLSAFAAGAAFGSGITALTTPMSGPELRGKLGTRARRAGKQATKLSRRVEGKLGGARATVASLARRASGSATPTRSAAARAAANGKAIRRPRASVVSAST